MRTCSVPEEVNGFPFRVVAFRTRSHGVVLFSCRWNAELYKTPGAQIREQECETFEDPDFVVIKETVIERRVFSHV